MSVEKQHGYPNCDCDLVGGDEECKIQPPYETAGGTIARLQHQLAAVTKEGDDARNTNRELNRVKQQLEHTLNVESGRKAWHGYFEAAMSILRSEDAKREKLQASNASLRDALDSIRIFGSDTLSGRVDGPDDSQWQRDSVLEMTKRARAALKDRP